MFENYGDVNFFDGGVLIEKEDNGYHVIKCNLDCDTEKYFLTDDVIDINDTWIDKNEVESFCDKTDDDALFASDVVSYYGTQNSYYMNEEMTKAEVVNYMQDFKNRIPKTFYCENFTNIEEE